MKVGRAAVCLVVGLLACFGIMAVGSTGRADAGVPDGWQLVPVPGAGLTSVSCPDVTFCWAVGIATQPTTSAGPQGPGLLTAQVVASRDGGYHWSAQELATPLAANTSLASISCPDDQHCWAVGQTDANTASPVVLATSDGGASWSAQTVPSGGGYTLLNGVSCADAERSVAVGAIGTSPSAAYLLDTSDGGHDWSVATPPPGQNSMSGVSCPTPGVCYATAVAFPGGPPEGVVDLSEDGGATWTVSDTDAVQLAGVSCRY